MPGPNYVLDKGYVIDAASNIFKAQKMQSTKEHVTECTTLNDATIGILQETVSATDAGKRVASVRIEGISRCIASAAISIGQGVRATTAGKMVALAATTAKQNQVGIAQTAAAADGDHFDVLLTPGVSVDT